MKLQKDKADWQIRNASPLDVMPVQRHYRVVALTNSEQQFQSELDFPWVGSAGYLSKSSVAPPGIETSSAPKRGVIEDIEEFRPELVLDPFGDASILEKSEVPVLHYGSPHRVP